MTKIISGVALVICLGDLCGCAHSFFQRTQTGELHGKVIVEWYKPNLFVYRPDSVAPLTFKRKSGATIQPGMMYTDGGSIPRAFWVFRNYSPWGYGPAFIVHDWLFHMHNCKLPGYDQYDVHDAAAVMSEVMKSLMKSPHFDYGSESSVYLMYQAVQTAPALAAWENGRCINPAEESTPAKPDATFVVEAP
jgi:Protein of unknown function (DUF1353)